MGIVIDLIILAIVLLCIVMGYVKGLTGSLLKIVSFVLAIVIAFVLFKPVSSLIINNTNWDENLEQSIRQMVLDDHNSQDVQNSNENDKENGQNNGTNSNQSNNEKSSSMPSIIINYINDAIEKAGEDAKESIVDSTAREVAETIINGGVILTLFIVARIVLIFIKGLAKLITKLPIIKQFDKAGGIIFGLVQSAVIIYVLLALISFISPMLTGTPIIQGIQESYVGSALYNNNLLLKIIF